MNKIKVAIIREGKIPHDKRTPLTPSQCKQVVTDFPNVELIIQPSPWRAFTDEEYRKEGLTLQEDISDCEIMLGIKEVPAKDLIVGKKYMFFSHTIKKQKHNQKLFLELIKNKML